MKYIPKLIFIIFYQSRFYFFFLSIFKIKVGLICVIFLSCLRISSAGGLVIICFIKQLRASCTVLEFALEFPLNQFELKTYIEVEGIQWSI